MTKATRIRSLSEVSEALKSLVTFDRKRIDSIARSHANKCGVDPDDLLSDAMAALLSGDRGCPSDVPVVTVLAGVLRSLASNENMKGERRAEAGALEVTSEDYGDILESRADQGSPTPEEQLDESERASAIHKFLEEEFEDDEQALLTLFGMFDGLRGKELSDEIGISKKELATVRRRIKRKLGQYQNE